MRGMMKMGTAKAKGTAFETAIVKYFTEHGFNTVRRVVLGGAAGDKGDIWIGEHPLIPYLVIECKNYAKELPYKMIEDFMLEAHTEYKNATGGVGFYAKNRALLIVKRPNLGIADSWLCWKNENNITFRVRLGDVMDKFICDKGEDDNSKCKTFLTIFGNNDAK